MMRKWKGIMIIKVKMKNKKRLRVCMEEGRTGSKKVK
jgi:hypothetical protein